MKLATRTADFFTYTGSQTESMALIRDAGFRYADYSFGCDYKSRTGIYGEDFSLYVDTVAETADRLGLTLVQAHAPMGAPLNDPDGSFLQATKLCVEACGRWGIPNLVVHSGYLSYPSKEDTFARNRDFFLPLLRKAEEYGLNILVENFYGISDPNFFWIDNATDLRRMIETVDHPLFHAIWDVGHANFGGHDQYAGIMTCGERLKVLHLHDNNGQADLHIPAFQGNINWDDVMRALRDVKFEGELNFEVAVSRVPEELREPLYRYIADSGKLLREKYGL